MRGREVCVWLDERWYDALTRQLKKEDMTVEEMLDEYLDKLIEQLPERVYEKISRELWEEDQQQREAMEAARRISVFRVTQGGRTDHLLTEGNASMDALHTAMRLRAYLLAKGNSPQRFIQNASAANRITPEMFEEYTDELRQGAGRVTAALDINFDRGEFSALDALNGWETYTIRDVSTAAWHASRKTGLDWDRRLDIFAAQLEGKLIRCEAQEVEPPAGPTM